jgi:importin-7
MAFLCQPVSSRTKTTFLPTLSFVNGVLDTHPTATQRVGALNMTSAPAPFAMHRPDAKYKMEDFTMKHVYPAFTAPEGHMRAVVPTFAWTVGGYRPSNTSQANEAVAAEVRSHMAWAGNEVRRYSSPSVQNGS